MRVNVLMSAAAAAASLVVCVPSVASAQAYDGYRAGYGTFDRDYRAPRYDDGRRDAWAARDRWERREWRERERARRYRDRAYRDDAYGYGYDRY